MPEIVREPDLSQLPHLSNCRTWNLMLRYRHAELQIMNVYYSKYFMFSLIQVLCC